MKKNILTIIIVMLLGAPNICAQEKEVELTGFVMEYWLKLKGYTIVESENNEYYKYGLSETATGKVIFPPTYSDIVSYNPLYKVLKVTRGAKYGVVNLEGKEVIPTKYYKIHSFSNVDGIACVQEGDHHCGFMDYKGNVITPCKYEAVAFFNEGFAFVKSGGLWGIINSKGQEVVSPKYNEPGHFKEGKAFVNIGNLWGVINSELKEIVTPKYDRESEFVEGMAFVKMNGLYGFINQEGKEVIAPQYKNVRSFNEGLAPVMKGKKWGFINKANQMVIPCEYDNFGEGGFKEGNVVVWKNKKVGRVDRKGKVLIPPIYDVVYNFHDGLAAVIKNGKLGYVDSTGVLVIPCIYDSPNIQEDKFEDIDNEWKFFGNVAFVKYNGKYVLIDKLGNRVNNEAYDTWNHSDREEIIETKKEGKEIYIDLTGNEFLTKREAAIASWMDFFSAQNEGRINDYGAETQCIIGRKLFNGGKDNLPPHHKNYKMATMWLTAAKQKGLKGLDYLGHDVYLYDIDEMLNQCQFEIDEENVESELPQIEWLSITNSVTNKNYELRVGIKSKSAINEIQVLANGQRFRGMSRVYDDQFAQTVKTMLSLKEGANNIEVKVRNKAGEVSLCKTISYKPSKQNPTPSPIEQNVQTTNKENRVALVIGNAAYQVDALKTPINDVKAVTEKLRSMGYSVLLVEDATKKTIETRLIEFSKMTVNSDAALFYYAGHGVSTSNSVNYMVPINHKSLKSDEDIYGQCVKMSWVLDYLADAKLKILLLDNCRTKLSDEQKNNGIQANYQSMNRDNGKNPNEVIVYATSNGYGAYDAYKENDMHSPFAEAVLSAWEMPHINIDEFTKRVKSQVYNNTSGAQQSWVNSSFFGDFKF